MKKTVKKCPHSGTGETGEAGWDCQLLYLLWPKDTPCVFSHLLQSATIFPKY